MPAANPERIEYEKKFLDMLVDYQGPIVSKDARRKFAKEAYEKMGVIGKVSNNVRNIMSRLFKSLQLNSPLSWVTEDEAYKQKFEEIAQRFNSGENKENEDDAESEEVVDPNLQEEAEDGEEEDEVTEGQDEPANADPLPPPRKASLLGNGENRPQYPSFTNGNDLVVEGEEVVETSKPGALEAPEADESSTLDRSGYINDDGSITDEAPNPVGNGEEEVGRAEESAAIPAAEEIPEAMNEENPIMDESPGIDDQKEEQMSAAIEREPVNPEAVPVIAGTAQEQQVLEEVQENPEEEQAPPVLPRARQTRKRKNNEITIGQNNSADQENAPPPPKVRRTADALIIQQGIELEAEVEAIGDNSRRRSPRGRRIEVPALMRPVEDEEREDEISIARRVLQRPTNEAGQGETPAVAQRNPRGRRQASEMAQGPTEADNAPAPPTVQKRKRSNTRRSSGGADQGEEAEPPVRARRPKTNRAQSVPVDDAVETRRNVFKVTPQHVKDLENNIGLVKQIAEQVRRMKDEKATREAAERQRRASSVSRNARGRSRAGDDSPQQNERGGGGRSMSRARSVSRAPSVSRATTSRARTPAPASGRQGSARAQPGRAGDSPTGYPNIGPNRGRATSRSRSVAPSTPKKARKN